MEYRIKIGLVVLGKVDHEIRCISIKIKLNCVSFLTIIIIRMIDLKLKKKKTSRKNDIRMLTFCDLSSLRN